MKSSKIFCCISVIMMISVPADMKKKKKKNSMEYVKCSEHFLWRALDSAKEGEKAAEAFLSSSLIEIGFSPRGIQPNTVAVAWQSLMTKQISPGSVFSDLQKIGVAAGVTKTDETVPCNNTETIYDDSMKNEQASQKVGVTEDLLVKDLTRTIKRIYEKKQSHVNTEVLEKKRNKRMQKIVKGFIVKYKNSTLCTASPQNTQTFDKTSKKKQKSLDVDFVKISIHMIGEMIQKNVCEEPSEAFRLAYEKFQSKYKQFK